MTATKHRDEDRDDGHDQRRQEDGEVLTKVGELLAEQGERAAHDASPSGIQQLQVHVFERRLFGHH